MASAASSFALATVWLFAAVVAPELPVPLLAPPAASTVPTVPVVVLLPIWPFAPAEPVVLVAVPVLLTLLVLVIRAVVELLPPFSLAPVVRVPKPPFAMLVLETSMPSP